MKVSLIPKPDMSGWEKLKQLELALEQHRGKIHRLDKTFRKYCPNCSDIERYQDGCIVAMESFNPVWLVERRRRVDNKPFWACPKCNYTWSSRNCGCTYGNIFDDDWDEEDDYISHYELFGGDD